MGLLELTGFRAIVPPGAGTGPIAVTTFGGNWIGHSSENFVVDQPVVFVAVPALIAKTLFQVSINVLHADLPSIGVTLTR